MEENKSKLKTMGLCILVGIPVIVVAVLFGILIYDRYLDNKEPQNNTVEKVENNNENKDEDEEELEGYTKIDISKQNIYPIYKRYEKTEGEFSYSGELVYDGKFVIENNKLYFKMNNINKEINIVNPKKVLIGLYGQDPTFVVYVLSTEGKIYSFHCILWYEFINDDNPNISVEKMVDGFAEYMNENIVEETEFGLVSDISAINTHGSDWEDTYFTYTKNNKEMITRIGFDDKTIAIDELKVSLGPIEVKSDKTVYDNAGNKVDIKPKYLIEYISETGHGAFLDEDNYLYVSTYTDYEEIKKGKVINVYKANDNSGNILVKFENGIMKNLSEYYDW